jgi:hypothetical protein
MYDMSIFLIYPRVLTSNKLLLDKFMSSFPMAIQLSYILDSSIISGDRLTTLLSHICIQMFSSSYFPHTHEP